MNESNQLASRSDLPLKRAYNGPFYITHVNNLCSILEHGILSHESIEKEGIRYTPIYDEEIVMARRSRQAPNGKSLWHFANLYYQPRNAMLYRVLLEKDSKDIVVLSVRPNIQNREDIFIALGGAGSPRSEIMPRREGLKARQKHKKLIDREWWSDVDDSKRLGMAECLVPDGVPPDLITSVYVASDEVRTHLRSMPGLENTHIIPDPYMFFEPEFNRKLTEHLSLVKGDLFFSKMHTLTISVNCVGVMGKGLASRAKYMFPAAYVYYQDLCRQRKLQLGKPYLYKRENSVDVQLADEPSSLDHPNCETWYLLFPTKHHWRYRSDLTGIEQGLKWIQENYKKEGILSLSVPALGCGLGWLEWEQVGPIMCHYLSALDIPVQVYLPAEKDVSEQFLTKDFLLDR